MKMDDILDEFDVLKNASLSIVVELEKIANNVSGYTDYYQEIVNERVEEYRKIVNSFVKRANELRIDSATKIRIEEDICEVIKRVDALTVLDCGKRRKDKTRNLNEYQILCNTVDAIESIVSRFNQDINMMRAYELKSFLVSASNQLSAFKSHFESSL